MTTTTQTGNDEDDDYNNNATTTEAAEATAATDDYGKERLWGAIAWGITNLIIGPILDYCGGDFWVLYPMAIASTILLLIARRILMLIRI